MAPSALPDLGDLDEGYRRLVLAHGRLTRGHGDHAVLDRELDEARKIFGTGLMSGGDEMEKAAAGATERRPFTIDNVLTRDKAVNEQNEILFVFDSIDALKLELRSYFSTL